MDEEKWLALANGQTRDGQPAVLGADVRPETVYAAYRSGLFVIPADEDWQEIRAARWKKSVESGDIPVIRPVRSDFELAWWSPDPRQVLTPSSVRLGHSVRRTLKKSGWVATVNEAFDAVVRRCGVERGGESWLSEELSQGYRDLHAQGRAISVEVWDGDRLVGGAFGVLLGGVFSGASGFREEYNASKVAVLEVFHRIMEAGGSLMDMQMPSDQMASIGAFDISRDCYHAVLKRERDRVCEPLQGALLVERLIDEVDSVSAKATSSICPLRTEACKCEPSLVSRG